MSKSIMLQAAAAPTAAPAARPPSPPQTKATPGPPPPHPRVVTTPEMYISGTASGKKSPGGRQTAGSGFFPMPDQLSPEERAGTTGDRDLWVIIGNVVTSATADLARPGRTLTVANVLARNNDSEEAYRTAAKRSGLLAADGPKVRGLAVVGTGALAALGAICASLPDGGLGAARRLQLLVLCDCFVSALGNTTFAPYARKFIATSIASGTNTYDLQSMAGKLWPGDTIAADFVGHIFRNDTYPYTTDGCLSEFGAMYQAGTYKIPSKEGG